MDALEFLMERRRMCDSYRHCEGCPFGGAKMDGGDSDEVD